MLCLFPVSPAFKHLQPHDHDPVPSTFPCTSTQPMAHDVGHSERERQRQAPHRNSASTTTAPNPTIAPIFITHNAPSNLPSSIPSFTLLPLLSPPLTPTMVFTTPKASPSPMSDRSVSGAPELVGSFVEKYKDIKSRYEEAQAKADKYERLYLELKVRADELAELEASLPTVKRLEAELEHEARLRQKATDELEQLKREQEELLAMQ
ncbi:hypothetical protein CcaverHIS002_0301290 [Cutaneotrichosporon cavernicola]|nr:hypothetical protein CcaverHIS002_0301290 [Cutaneotrichosporon cavernicola]